MVYTDGDVVEVGYAGSDLKTTTQFEDFCQSSPILQTLMLKVEQVTKLRSQYNRQPLSSWNFSVGDLVYVDLRCFGEAWYQGQENLPDLHTVQYVVLGKYIQAPQGKLDMFFPVFSYKVKANGWFIFLYGRNVVQPVGSVYPLVFTVFLIFFRFSNLLRIKYCLWCNFSTFLARMM